MMFLTKGASTRRAMFWFVLALCCLSDALGAKIMKKAKPEAVESTKDEVNATKETTTAETNATAVVITNSADASDAVNDDDDNDDDDDDDDDGDDDVAAAADDDDDDDDSAEKQTQETQAAVTNATADNEVQSLSASSVWNTVTGLWNWLRSDFSESLFADDDDDEPAKTRTARSLDAAVESRTFGKIRRLQMALIPIIFKFGVLSAMIAFLVAISMKSLFLLKVLVFMNAIAILGKFLTFKSSLVQLEHTAPAFNYHGWNPHVRESWAATGPAEATPQHPSKEIHLHIHGGQAQLAQAPVPQGHVAYEPPGWQSRSDPYGGYLPLGNVQVTEERNEATNMANPQPYTARHLAY